VFNVFGHVCSISVQFIVFFSLYLHVFPSALVDFPTGSAMTTTPQEAKAIAKLIWNTVPTLVGPPRSIPLRAKLYTYAAAPRHAPPERTRQLQQFLNIGAEGAAGCWSAAADADIDAAVDAAIDIVLLWSFTIIHNTTKATQFYM